MASIRQFSEESQKRIAKVVRNSEGGGNGRPPAGRSRRRDPRDESYWVRIVSSSVETAGAEWNYQVVIMRGGAATDDGLEDATEIESPAKNLWEMRLTNAGYENAVTDLYAIPVDAIVRAWMGRISGTQVLLFSERNEPNCG